MQRQPEHGLPTLLPRRWRASIRYRLATWQRHPGRAAIASLTLVALCTATAFAIRALVANLSAAPSVSSSFVVTVPKDLENRIGRSLRTPSFDTLALKPSIRMLPDIDHRGLDRHPTAHMYLLTVNLFVQGVRLDSAPPWLCSTNLTRSPLLSRILAFWNHPVRTASRSSGCPLTTTTK